MKHRNKQLLSLKRILCMGKRGVARVSLFGEKLTVGNNKKSMRVGLGERVCLENFATVKVIAQTRKHTEG
eukprot:snap_masked-scaffold_3-processed-gene-6.7-mRNA-1 protein AED:1.00 eAED:1.00 QI:0/0/0/0/1/1/2/0/69